MPDIEPGPGEIVIGADEIDTAGVQLEEDPTPPARAAASGLDPRVAMDEKEAINQEIIRALRANLENPVFPILVVRIFNLGGALYDAGLDADMPPAHRLIIGCVVLIVVVAVTNPDVIEKTVGKWKKIAKPRAAAPGLPERAPIDVKAEANPDGA